MSCPACHATYEIPDHVLVNIPSRLRCARCGAEWTWGGDLVRPLGAEIPAHEPQVQHPEIHPLPVHADPDLFARSPLAASFQDSMDIPERPAGPELTAPGPVPAAGPGLRAPQAVTREQAFNRIVEQSRERAAVPVAAKTRRDSPVIVLIAVIVLILLFFILHGLFAHTGSPASSH